MGAAFAVRAASSNACAGIAGLAAGIVVTVGGGVAAGAEEPAFQAAGAGAGDVGAGCAAGAVCGVGAGRARVCSPAAERSLYFATAARTVSCASGGSELKLRAPMLRAVWLSKSILGGAAAGGAAAAGAGAAAGGAIGAGSTFVDVTGGA